MIRYNNQQRTCLCGKSFLHFMSDNGESSPFDDHRMECSSKCSVCGKLNTNEDSRMCKSCGLASREKNQKLIDSGIFHTSCSTCNMSVCALLFTVRSCPKCRAPHRARHTVPVPDCCIATLKNGVCILRCYKCKMQTSNGKSWESIPNTVTIY